MSDDTDFQPLPSLEAAMLHQCISKLTGFEIVEETIKDVENRYGSYFDCGDGIVFFLTDDFQELILSMVTAIILSGDEIIIQPRNNLKNSQNDNQVKNIKDNSALKNDLNNNKDVQKSNITKKHKCYLCLYSTSKEKKLVKHLKTHPEKKLHKCSLCDSKFKLLKNLQSHEKIHAIGYFKCQYCHRAFVKPGDLSKHWRYGHFGVRPFKCDQCEYTSAKMAGLKHHSRVHAEVKPVFPCSLCPRKYSRRYDLKVHIQKTHG